jgi:hypothetical protein
MVLFDFKIGNIDERIHEKLHAYFFFDGEHCASTIIARRNVG